MKKLLALMMAVVLCLSAGVVAFAASSDNERTDIVLTGSVSSDSYKGIAVPGKDSKILIEIVTDADNSGLTAALAQANNDIAAANTEIATLNASYQAALLLKNAYDTAVSDKGIADDEVTRLQAVPNPDTTQVNAAQNRLTDAENDIIANGDFYDSSTNPTGHDPSDANHIATTGDDCSYCQEYLAAQQAYDDAYAVYQPLKAAYDQAQLDLPTALQDQIDAALALNDADTAYNAAAKAAITAYETAQAKLSLAQAAKTQAETNLANSSSKYTVLTSEQAWKAYDTDKAFKLTFKATKGSDYIKSYEIKKNTSGEMYVQVNYNEYYLGGMKDITYEITLTVTNATKFNARLTSAATAAGISLSRNQYVKFETNNMRYGFNGSNVKDPYKDFEIKDSDSTDYDIIANLDSSSGTAGETSDKDSAIHYKKGTGETYSFDYGNGNAFFEVKMDGQPVVNLYLSTAAIKALTSAYPDAEMLFWDWRGKPELDFTATVELYYDEDDVGDDPYLYKWDGSVLTEVSSADFDDETCTFKTRSLGAYVISDIELDTSVVSSTTAAATEIGEATEAPEDGGTAGSNTTNPDTGASDFMSVAIAMAVVSLVAAGALTLKK